MLVEKKIISDYYQYKNYPNNIFIDVFLLNKN